MHRFSSSSLTVSLPCWAIHEPVPVPVPLIVLVPVIVDDDDEDDEDDDDEVDIPPINPKQAFIKPPCSTSRLLSLPSPTTASAPYGSGYRINVTELSYPVTYGKPGIILK